MGVFLVNELGLDFYAIENYFRNENLIIILSINIIIILKIPY